MVDFDFMRSCLKEKIQAKVVFQVKIRADDTAKKLLSQKKKIVFLNYAKSLKQEGVKLFL